MQYKKLVSYVFQYENGKKGENIGFARVEFQNDKIVLNVHFRIRDCVNEWLQLYLFKNEGGRLEGMPVGSGRMKWNTFDMQTFLTKDKMDEYVCQADNLKGLYIQSESGKIFASSWDEGELSIDAFYPIQVRQETALQEELKAESVVETEIIEESVEVEDADIFETEGTIREETIETQEIYDVEECSEEITISEDRKEELHTETKEEEKTEDLQMTEKQQSYTIQPFERIDLRQLRRLERKEWGLKDNRFLLHGYYNYHYLCLKKTNETQAVLGVPGIYHPMEKTVAAMYGFDSFCPKEGTDVRNGLFGYWCRTVALDNRE